MKIDRGIALGYRRNHGAGTWVMRVTRDGEDWTKKIGIADDYEEATSRPHADLLDRASKGT